jgi:single-strand selective monofunctional uracil DNA glycosylase
MTPLAALSRRLARAAGALEFGPPVACVYNPLVYARAPHEAYLERWGSAPKEILLVGMNPGPFGMMQTGVPFGEVAAVRDWLGIAGPVGRPRREHPKRPVEGFACARSEVSGARLWGWARQRFGTPERFFARFFVWNWCPLGFLAASGANLTPVELAAADRARLASVCDRFLAEVVELLEPRLAVGIGVVAEAALARATAGRVAVARIPHPSPASPAANRGWAEQAEKALATAGVALA